MNKIHVLLSGGVGSRLWPLSRKSKPKQYIPLFDNKTLFQLCVERNKSLTDKLLVVGNKDNYQLSIQNLSEIENVQSENIIEYTPRNTAAAIAFAALKCNSNDLLLVTPSDHIINEIDLYKNAVNSAFKLAEENFLVTFGIKPTKPETGYGYIEFENDNVISFREKPSLFLAEEFFKSKNFYWNSGIFCFRASIYLEELKKYRPDIYNACEIAFNKMNNEFLPELESLSIPSESIDYAVFEKSKNIKVIASNFNWSDLGSFDSLFDYFELQKSDFIQNNNLIITQNKKVEILGLENIVLVETNDAILVMAKAESQKVKTVYEQLEKTNPSLIK